MAAQVKSDHRAVLHAERPLDSSARHRSRRRVKDKDRAFESREADLAGHIGNPLGGEDVNSSNEISTPDSNEAAKADENAKSKKGKDKEKDERPLQPSYS